MAKWEYETPTDGAVAAGGALAALFGNHSPKCPGHFSNHLTEPRATLLAREAIQNSWDAAIEYAGDNDPEMSLAFSFEQLSDAEKDSVCNTLGLDELRDRVRRLPANGWQTLRLPTANEFGFLDTGRPLNVLKITETGTTGMYGRWNFKAANRSKMILAMLSVGFQKHEGHMAGGSYGQGKAGLISASATRTVIAYSCFKKREDDPGITRRLLGVTYWGGYDLEDLAYTGFCKYWAGDNQAFENEEADRIAKSLGLVIRDPDADGGLGTTFLLISPTPEPNELLQAVERNWWPAIEQFGGFEISITDYDGQEMVPRPKKDENLRPYIRAYEIALKAERAELGKNERFYRPRDMEIRSDGRRPTAVGRLGLVADPEGWSYPSQRDSTAHRSLVALIRGPRMITEYWQAGTGGRRPYVRGVFIAESGIVDKLLRQTEPPLHNSWDEVPGEGGVDPDAPILATKVHDFSRTSVDAFRNELKPPAAPRDQHHLPDFDRILKKFFTGGRNRKGATTASRPRNIHVQPGNTQHLAPDPETPGLIRMEADCNFSLTDIGRSRLEKEGTAKAEIRIQVSFRFDEDGRTGSAEDSRALVHLDNRPKGFTQTVEKQSLVLTGKIGPDDEITVVVHTDGFNHDYAGKAIFSAEFTATGDEPDAGEGSSA
jgi:hypothetical protein